MGHNRPTTPGTHSTQGDTADGHHICWEVFFYTSSAALVGLLKYLLELALTKEW